MNLYFFEAGLAVQKSVPADMARYDALIVPA
jgi:hypothetical protein